jgi:hypothetical protein
MPRGSAPRNAIDGLVGVADRNQVATAPGDRLEQPHLSTVAVLVLVDEDRGELTAQIGADVRTLGEHGGAMNQLAVVEHAFSVQDVEVLLEERADGRPLRPPGLRPGSYDVGGLETELARSRQHQPDLFGEPPRPQGGAQARRPLHATRVSAAAEQLAERDVLFGGREHP